MNRIIILGPSGTGKTTLCRRLGEKLGLKELHLDSVYWLKDWKNIDKETFDIKMKSFLTKHPKFVIDGNYTNNKHFKYRLDLADTIIFLDFGTNQSLKGIYQRAHEFKHLVRSDMAEGCVEGIDQVFLKYVASFSRFKSKYLKATVKKYDKKKKVLVFKSREELNNWYHSL